MCKDTTKLHSKSGEGILESETEKVFRFENISAGNLGGSTDIPLPKMRVPKIEVNEEPVFCGFLPPNSGNSEIIPFSEFIRKDELSLNAKYFSPGDSDKKNFGWLLKKFILATVKWKNIEIPLQSKIAGCEIIYRDFSIAEVRLRCVYPSSLDLHGVIGFSTWSHGGDLQITLDEDFNTCLNQLTEESHYFFYQIFDDDFGNRIRCGWNVPEEPPQSSLIGKDLWVLPVLEGMKSKQLIQLLNTASRLNFDH